MTCGCCDIWGSSWEEPNSKEAVQVPQGRTPSMGGRSPTAAVAAGPIIPLGRASGSRVSRILEGSM